MPGNVYTDQMFNATATSITLVALNAGITATAGRYSVVSDGRLLRVIIVLAGQSAASLLEAIRVDLDCITFVPNTMRFAASGGGLRTAPAVPVGSYSYDVSQEVKASQTIGGNYIFNVAAVTPNVQVLGVFSS